MTEVPGSIYEVLRTQPTQYTNGLFYNCTRKMDSEGNLSSSSRYFIAGVAHADPLMPVLRHNAGQSIGTSHAEKKKKKRNQKKKKKNTASIPVGQVAVGDLAGIAAPSIQIERLKELDSHSATVGHCLVDARICRRR